MLRFDLRILATKLVTYCIKLCCIFQFKMQPPTTLDHTKIKMISIPIGEIYAQVAKSAISYYSLIVLPLTNFTLHPLTCCVIDKGIKGLV